MIEALEDRQLMNVAPIALNDGPFSVQKGALLQNLDLKANDSVSVGDVATVSIASYPNQGYLYQDDQTGNWSYSAPSDFVGSVTFAYRLFDGALYSEPAIVTIEVTNQAPIAADDGPYSVLHGQTLTGIDLKANDSDPDGDATTVSILTYPTQGYFYQDYYTGNWSYSAPPNYVGQVTLTYRLYDGAEYSAPATVMIDVTNQVPIATDVGPFSVLHGGTINGIDLLGAASDPDNDSLSVEIVSYPTQGYLYQDWNTGKWNYSAPSGYAGPVTFAYRVYDGQAYSAPASVTIDVTNQAPIAVDDGPYSVLHGQTLTGINLKANDSDPDGDSTTLSIVSYPSQGYLYQDYYTGDWNYSAPSNYVGPVTFTYRLSDGAAFSDTATVTINVTEPVASVLANRGTGYVLVTWANGQAAVGPNQAVAALGTQQFSVEALTSNATYAIQTNTDIASFLAGSSLSNVTVFVTTSSLDLQGLSAASGSDALPLLPIMLGTGSADILDIDAPGSQLSFSLRGDANTITGAGDTLGGKWTATSIRERIAAFATVDSLELIGSLGDEADDTFFVSHGIDELDVAGIVGQLVTNEFYDESDATSEIRIGAGGIQGEAWFGNVSNLDATGDIDSVAMMMLDDGLATIAASAKVETFMIQAAQGNAGIRVGNVDDLALGNAPGAGATWYRAQAGGVESIAVFGRGLTAGRIRNLSGGIQGALNFNGQYEGRRETAFKLRSIDAESIDEMRVESRGSAVV